MRKQKWRVLLLVLVVVLLTIVSSRVSPPLPDAEVPSVSVPDSELTGPENPVVSDAPAATPEIPVEAVTPSPTPEIDLPDVTIHEWNLKLVNNRNILSSSFAPDVSEIYEGQYFASRAGDAL